MEVAYIGLPFRIAGYTPLKGIKVNYPYTWFNQETKEIHYGNMKISNRDIMLKTEEQFNQAIFLVMLGITDKETLQQLLGV